MKSFPTIPIEEEVNKNELKKLLNEALSEPQISKKGFAFELFFENFMKKQELFKIVFKHSRSSLGEVDYVYRNENIGSFWSQYTHVCVECKNWRKKISSVEMDHLVNLIKDKRPLPCLGVFVTNSAFEPSAKTSMKNARIGDQILIVPFEGRDLTRLIELGFKDSIVKTCEESIFKKRYS